MAVQSAGTFLSPFPRLRLCLSQWRANEKIERERWIYRYPLQSATGFSLLFPFKKQNTADHIEDMFQFGTFFLIAIFFSQQTNRKTFIRGEGACARVSDCFHMALLCAAIEGEGAAALSTGWDCNGRILGTRLCLAAGVQNKN